ncbi:hypothetical protein DBR32_01560 [Taibaiella sp. KBW10]|uniref:sensor histidine kinase n=1 Tax=Taibaiella sp. KBW10 TaxID=2153357 RepID=UPI000F5B7C2E|nr:two-component regulator propeller domain-containing protein [Taibaiella sp. KBW10]RQO32322.1 hypothetical protein DBR32_01560 [Taibaiella sp. KBW10]
MLGLYPCAQAQSYVKRNTFTTNEGLPSNHIYDITEDNKGFLWIATDNGVSRFDGKYFQNFSVREGLPSNEVLQVLKDGDGHIWINCFKQVPAYFDEINGRFVPIKNHSSLDIIAKSLLVATHLADGSVKFYNYIGYVTFKNKQITDYQFMVQDRIIIKNESIDLRLKHYNNGAYCSYLYANNQLLDSIVLKSKNFFIKTHFHENEIFQFTRKNKIYKIYKINIRPLSYQLDSLNIPENITWYKFVAHNMIITSLGGNVYIYNKNNFSFITKLEGDVKANCAYVDKFKKIWVGTLDEGLVYYDNNKIRTIAIPPNYVRPNFLSISINNNKELFAGNYYGQVLKVKGGQFSRYENQYENYQTWIRKLICINNDIVTVNDRGYNINFNQNKQILNAQNTPTVLKDAVSINDSTIVLGTISGLIALNLNTGKTKSLDSDRDRALNLVTTDGNLIYYIGTKGLYRYNIAKDTSIFIPLPPSCINENLSVLAAAADHTLWASSRRGDLLIFKHDTVYAIIKENATLPENITCMLAHQQKIWIGSKKGIAVLAYYFVDNKLHYTINTISKNDGLPSNTINALVAQNDTVYAATENGIALIPANYQNPKFEIRPELTGIKINQVSIPIAQNYKLESNQNNITLQFAGIELSGHFKAIQYRLNEDTKWGTLDGNTLNIQLNSGHHTIYIRAIDANNQVSKQILQLHFSIKTPFYQAIWFWILIASVITASVLRWFNWRRLEKQKAIYEQKLALELQRKKITADLHDDIGATLSSLQLNSAVANQLIHTDTNRTKDILHKIEDQSQSLADKIGDIIWSMKPGKDEFMTIGSRIKNFANDILGSGNMDYKIIIDPNINKTIQDITTRKNIVLITKEALNNIAKYSDASEAFVCIEIKGTQIELLIRDNGNGFDVCDQKGNGLANMRIRTEELNGLFTIESAPKKGTVILVTIPLVP